MFEQTRLELSAQAGLISRAIRQGGWAGLPPDQFLEKIRLGSKGKIVWLRVAPGHAEPAYRIVRSKTGLVMVTAFPVLLPPDRSRRFMLVVAPGSGATPQRESIEIGYSLRAGNSSLGAIQRSLILNVVAGVALFAALARVALRLRRYARFIGKRMTNPG
jgi:hypothetical protein